MRLEGYADRTGETRYIGLYISVGKPEGKRRVGRSRQRQANNNNNNNNNNNPWRYRL
jgi:hypothetical protein